MAWVAMEDKIKVGFLVYEAFYPQNPGIIRNIVKDVMEPYINYPNYTTRRMVVEIEWLKKTKKREKITVQSVLGLMDFEELISDHRRKYENQSKLAEQLRKM